jgi:hypothetical protein
MSSSVFKSVGSIKINDKTYEIAKRFFKLKNGIPYEGDDLEEQFTKCKLLKEKK